MYGVQAFDIRVTARGVFFCVERHNPIRPWIFGVLHEETGR